MSENTNIKTREESLPEHSHGLPTISPLVDIYENEDEILLQADMPGVAKEDININIDNGTLDISASRQLPANGAANWEEFANVEYRRTFSVPQSIDVAKVKAKLNEGVLHLHLPKSEAAKPRLIEVQTM